MKVNIEVIIVQHIHTRFIIYKFDSNHLYCLQSSYANGKAQGKSESYL